MERGKDGKRERECVMRRKRSIIVLDSSREESLPMRVGVAKAPWYAHTRLTGEETLDHGPSKHPSPFADRSCRLPSFICRADGKASSRGRRDGVCAVVGPMRGRRRIRNVEKARGDVGGNTAAPASARVASKHPRST